MVKSRGSRIVMETISKEAFEAMGKIIPVGIIVVKKGDDKIAYVNERAIELIGFNPSGLEFNQYIANMIKVHLAKEGFESYDELPLIKALLYGQATRNQELILERAGQTRLTILANVTPITGLEGVIIGALTVFEDITERKKAEETLIRSEKKYRRMFETSQDGIVSRDPNGQMLDCNHAYAKMVGYTKRELEKVSPPELLPKKWHEQRKRIFNQVMESGKSVIFEREYLRKDGTIFPASVRSWRLTDGKGEILGVWSVVRDITQQKNLQRELQQHNLQLEKLVEDRTRQLKDAERLAAIGATAGMVGHDIRNPLQAMISDVYLLRSELLAMPECKTKEGVAESLDSLENNIGYVNKIVADLQDFARPLMPTVAKINVKKGIELTLTNISIPKNIETTINADSLLKILVDLDMFRRILNNLITNAIQAMPNGGKLILSAQRKEENARIIVEDTGNGIPEHVKDKIFTPMVTTKSKGQGFGLAVVKRLVEAQGGTVSFESQNGHRTQFILEFPLLHNKKS
jgi:PAS domain S-box-containing protein